MSMAGLIAASTASVLWGLVIFYYKRLMTERGFVDVNVSRLFMALVVALPLVILSPSSIPEAKAFAVLSGAVALGLGDSLYFHAIKSAGASVAAPVAYTYVVVSQLVASLMGEAVGPLVAVASLVTFAGASLISTGERSGKRSLLGVATAFAAGLSWVASSALVKKATAEGVAAETVAAFRVLGAFLALWVSDCVRKRAIYAPKVGPPGFAVLAVADLILGAALFAYGIATMGISRTVIVVSLSPVVTLAYSKATGEERVTWHKALGTALIVLGVVLSQLERGQ